MNFRQKHRPEPVGFQIAPMIDVVFLLLTFFVTSQIFAQWETEIDITLPTAVTGEMPQRMPGEVILNLLPEGEVIVNGQALSPADLGGMLERLADLFPDQPILLRADEATAYRHVIGVLDACRSAGIWNISFATGVPED